MNQRDRNRVAAIERRIEHLQDRLAKWEHGSPARTEHELAALRWALRVIRAAEREDALTEYGR